MRRVIVDTPVRVVFNGSVLIEPDLHDPRTRVKHEGS